MAACRQLLGPDLAGHPVWNLRPKAPQQGEMNVPWHQDNAYVSPDAWDNLTVVAWIPLVDTNELNGCMQVLKGGHRSGQTAKHTCCQGGTWYVEMDEQDAHQKLGVDMQQDIVTCQMPAGSVLLMNAHSKFPPTRAICRFQSSEAIMSLVRTNACYKPMNTCCLLGSQMICV